MKSKLLKLVTEKMYEALFTDEESTHAMDMGNIYKVLEDKRNLNYDKYFM